MELGPKGSAASAFIAVKQVAVALASAVKGTKPSASSTAVTIVVAFDVVRVHPKLPIYLIDAYVICLHAYED